MIKHAILKEEDGQLFVYIAYIKDIFTSAKKYLVHPEDKQKFIGLIMKDMFWQGKLKIGIEIPADRIVIFTEEYTYIEYAILKEKNMKKYKEYYYDILTLQNKVEDLSADNNAKEQNIVDLFKKNCELNKLLIEKDAEIKRLELEYGKLAQRINREDLKNCQEFRVFLY